MNINRTSAASWFVLDGNSSGAAASGSAAGGGSAGSAPPVGGSPAPAAPSPSGTGSDAGSVPAEAGAAIPPSDSFAGMEDDLDFIDLGDGAAPGVTPDAVLAPSPVAPAAAQAPAPATPVAQPAPVPPQAGATPPQNVAAAPRSKVEAFLGDMTDENLVALAGWAAENPFKLSAEESAALDTDAMSVIPKLMGRVYAQALKSAAAMIQNFAPEIAQQAITKHSTTTAKSSEAMSEFYAGNPELNSKDHQAAVDRWAKAFRSQNPKASRAEAIKFVGLAVKTELGIAPGTPAAVRQPPFAPARPGGKAPVVSEGDDPYKGLDFDFDS